jgi:hypothetical protein
MVGPERKFYWVPLFTLRPCEPILKDALELFEITLRNNLFKNFKALCCKMLYGSFKRKSTLDTHNPKITSGQNKHSIIKRKLIKKSLKKAEIPYT